MYRLLRISIATAMLLSGLILFAQEPATIDSDPAVKFEQSPGYYQYLAFCRTPKAASPQMPKAGLPLDQIEFGIGWYVKASVSRPTSAGASPQIDGRIVISQHHVRFMPSNSQLADQYVDLNRDGIELTHGAGQPDAWLRSKDIVLNFQFRTICQSCAAGAPVPAAVNAAHVDQEFALLGETITKFESGWRKSYRMSKGDRVDLSPGAQAASVASSAAPRTAPAAGTSNAAHPETVAASVVPTPRAPSASTNSSAAVVRSSPPAVTGIPRKPLKIGSGAADGLLVKKIPPSYPLEAKLVRLEGTVVLHAVIDRTGDVSEVNALSGPPLLESAAVDAVKQWQYRPYSMNGQAVDVETTIDVVFALDGHPASRIQSARR